MLSISHIGDGFPSITEWQAVMKVVCQAHNIPPLKEYILLTPLPSIHTSNAMGHDLEMLHLLVTYSIFQGC